jgi:hypothetical protein
MTALNNGLKAMVLFLLLFTRVVSSQEQTCAQWQQCFLCRPACLPCYVYQGFIFHACNIPAVKKYCKNFGIFGCELCDTQDEICTQPGCDCSIIYHDCGNSPPDCSLTMIESAITTSLTITSVSTTTTSSMTTSVLSRSHPTQVTTSQSDS